MNRTIFLGALLALAGAMAQAQVSQPEPEKVVYFGYDRPDTMVPIYREVTKKEGFREREDSLGGLMIMNHVVDLNGDGLNEIIFKNKNASLCSVRNYCPITIASYVDEQWVSIGQFTGRDLKVIEGGAEAARPFADIQINSKSDPYRVSWNEEIGSYEVDLSEMALKVDWTSADKAFAGKEDFLDLILQRDLGSKYLFLKGASSEGDGVWVGAHDLNGDEDPEYFISVESAALCSKDCPLFIYRDLSEAPFARLNSTRHGVHIDRMQEEGKLRALYLQKSSGSVETLAWSPMQGRYEPYTGN